MIFYIHFSICFIQQGMEPITLKNNYFAYLSSPLFADTFIIKLYA